MVKRYLFHSNSSQASATSFVFPSDPFSSPEFQFPVGVDSRSPPRKKHRSSAPSLEEYQDLSSCSSSESSPEKGTVSPLQAVGSDCWTMTLENSPLWQQFDRIGTEMVITKGGRYMHLYS